MEIHDFGMKNKEKRLKGYYYFIKKITYLGIIMLAAFGVSTFRDAIPNQIYVTRGETAAYEFDVPVKVVLKEESMAVFENYSKQQGGVGDADYTVTCKLFGIFPVKDVDVMLVESDSVYASGMPIGIYAKTDGVLVVGTGAVMNEMGEEHRPSANLVKTGDYIVSINGEAVSDKRELTEKINLYGEKKEILGIRRNKEYIEVALTPVKNAKGDYMLGIWVRDDLAGVGTLTYCETNGRFGALGHSINDGNTGTLMEMSEGWIYATNIVGIRKGDSGMPGELSGIINYSKGECLGSITDNATVGIHGILDGNVGKVYKKDRYEVAYKQEIKRGTAYIISSVSGESMLYEIQIENLDFSGNEENKGILFRVTDEKLLEKTGGIVQGMSGSPIIQNGRIVGAVTHVFVNDPTRGYGIFIENMLEH